uniref:Major facilitator superfamily (MFS) profile domain-containing protein n=1 Tax=Stomoxys calcitrans TaxID=35570 RepID=A0A1I8NLQ5_STOCA
MAETPTLNYEANISGSKYSLSAAPTSAWYSVHHLSTMAAGAFIFFSGGMAMAHGLGWSVYPTTGYSLHFHLSWFVAVLIGAILSVPAIKIMPKKYITSISAALILMGGIVFIVAPYSIDVLIAGRYLNGMAVGLAITPYLMLIGDISRFGTRGTCLGIEQLSLTLGLELQIIISTQWDVTTTFAVNRLHGLLDVVFAIFICIALWHFVESPVDYLRMGDESTALSIMARLKKPPGANSAANILLMEHNTYLSEQSELGFGSCIGPMLKMILFRSMMLAFTFSLPLTRTFKYSKTATLSLTTTMLVAGIRILGGFLSLLITDRLGRKLPALISSLITGSLMITVAVICQKYDNLTNPRAMSYVFSFCLIIQFWSGLFAPLTSVYVAEAFPLKRKSYCIAFCVVLEQVIGIVILCLATPLGDDGTLIAQGIIILLASIFFGLTMPETKQTSLREAQKRFRHFFNWKSI